MALLGWPPASVSVCMTHKERGSASGVVIGVIAVIVLILIGLGLYAYKNPVEVAQNGESSTRIEYVATTTTTYVSTTTTAYEPDITARTYTAPRSQSYGGTYASGSAYHNGYGLTVPGSYTVTTGQDVYAGVYDTASLHFHLPAQAGQGAQAFQINVWSKEQWNDIRIQETINAKEGTGPTYFGEGSYLGENFTWIYSVIPGSYNPLAGIRFY